MSIKKRARRIDLDTEEHIYHLKVTLIGRVSQVILAPRSEFKQNRIQSSLCSSSLGQISRNLWCLGVQVASSPALQAERDCAISPGGHHANVPSSGCHGVPPTCCKCGTWSKGESSHPLKTPLQYCKCSQILSRKSLWTGFLSLYGNWFALSHLISKKCTLYCKTLHYRFNVDMDLS